MEFTKQRAKQYLFWFKWAILSVYPFLRICTNQILTSWKEWPGIQLVHLRLSLQEKLES